MNLFETVKGSVTTLEAAQRYGLHVSYNGMCTCPFHSDKHPSMRVDGRFHCFGCQADGDVIDFTARLYNLSARDAALKLANDFALVVDDRPSHSVKPKKRELTETERFALDANRCYATLADYRHMLAEWQTAFAPTSADAVWHPKFIEANQNLAATEYLLDLLLDGTTEEKKAVMTEQSQRLPILKRRVSAYREHKPPSVLSALRLSYLDGIPKPQKNHKEASIWNL